MNECSVEYVVLWGMFYLKTWMALFIKFHRENLETSCDLLPVLSCFSVFLHQVAWIWLSFRGHACSKQNMWPTLWFPQCASWFLVAFREAVRMTLDLIRILRRAHLWPGKYFLLVWIGSPTLFTGTFTFLGPPFQHLFWSTFPPLWSLNNTWIGGKCLALPLSLLLVGRWAGLRHGLGDPGAHPWVSPDTLPCSTLQGSGQAGVGVPLTWATASLGWAVPWEKNSAVLTGFLIISGSF